MGNMKDKHVQPIAFSKLLKRKKLTLEQYVRDNGIVTYELLINKCARLGVVPPTPDEFDALKVQFVNSPTEGIVVVESPEVDQKAKKPHAKKHVAE